MDLSLDGHHAFVGGSSRGIGLAAAIELAKMGASVTLVSRSEDVLKESLGKLNSSRGQKHDYLVADFSEVSKLEGALDAHLAKCGYKYSILINNTGGPPGGPIVDAAIDAFQAALQQHLLCNHLLATKLVPQMKELKYGRIVNVISTSVKIPLNGLGVSNTTRGAVANWSKTLANELGASGITVNNVLPGATGTERLSSIIENKSKKTGADIKAVEDKMKSAIPMGRFAEPKEIGSAIAFLASPAASYITGINVPVDGGRTGSL